MNALAKDSITLKLAGATVTLSAATLAELWLDKLRGKSANNAAPEPRIGEALDGGIYMGIVRGEDGQPDYRLVDLGEAPEPLDWADATKWAESKGGALPTRREQSVMFGNRAGEQYEPAWYWSSERYASNEAYAWVQNFLNGYQTSDHKDNGSRARAVRRVPVTEG